MRDLQLNSGYLQGKKPQRKAGQVLIGDVQTWIFDLLN
jgi:hypothetical protein